MKQLTVLKDMANVVALLSSVSASSAVVANLGLQGEFERAERELRDLEAALGEAEEGIRAFRDLEGKAVAHQDVEAVSTLRSQTDSLVQAFASVNSLSRRRANIFTSGRSACTCPRFKLTSR